MLGFSALYPYMPPIGILIKFSRYKIPHTASGIIPYLWLRLQHILFVRINKRLDDLLLVFRGALEKLLPQGLLKEHRFQLL